MRIFRILPFIALALPATAFAAAPRTLKDLATQVVTILDATTMVLIVAGIAVYFYGLSINILKFGEGEREKIRNYFFWGIIVLFVMVSIWGILRLLHTTLFGVNPYSTPRSTQQQNAPATIRIIES